MTPSKARITFRGFRPGGRGPASVLGELEAAVMEILWGAPGQSVNEVERALRRHRDIAHTTVLTTLDRMHRKGYLSRDKHGKAFLYRPRYSREEFGRGVAHEVLAALLADSTGWAVSAFVDLVGADPRALDGLEALIRAKREQQARKTGQST